jgi:phage-related protein
MLYKGTDNWMGGPAMIHDRGAEIVDLPQGTRVYPHDESIKKARAEGGKSISIQIAKIAESIIVREEADIDRIVERLGQRLEAAAENMA